MKINAEDVSQIAREVADLIDLERSERNGERWNYIRALLLASSQCMARGLGLHQAGAALERTIEREGLSEHTPIYGFEHEARGLMSAGMAPWLILAASDEHARHRDAFDLYRAAWSERLTVSLPAHDDPWEDWHAFYRTIEIAELTSGQSNATCYVCTHGPKITEVDMLEGRAAALDALGALHEDLARIYSRRRVQTPPSPAPVGPTPEEAQTAPHE